MGNARLWKTLEERDSTVRQAARSLTDKDGMRLAELEGIVGEENGYTAESDAAVLLDGLGIEEPLHERKMSELQGGQKVRVLLAQALFGSPPALLLDEPTNHLDLDSVHWLQDYLIEYEGVLIVISHDRHFLNSVCTHTADIDYQTVIMYNGGYDDMVLAKTSIRSRIESENAQRESKIAQLKRIHRALFGRHAFRAGHFAQEGSRAPAIGRAGAIQYRPPVHSLRRWTSIRDVIRSEIQQHREILRWREGDSAIHREGGARRKDRADGPQRCGQDHAAEVADTQRDRVHRRFRPRISGRRRHGHMGPQRGCRLFRAGPLGFDREGH